LATLALGFLRRQYLVILLSALLGLVVGGIVVALSHPTYTARARVSIAGTQKSQFIQQQALFTEGPLDAAQIESQLQVIKSRSIVASIVEQLKLMDDPEFVNPPSDPVKLAWSMVRRATDPVLGRPPAAPIAPTEMAILSLTDRIVARRVGASYTIEIAITTRSSGKSAQIANAVANAYIADQVEAKSRANRTASTWLQERLKELAAQAAAADKAVLDFKQKHSIVDADSYQLAAAISRTRQARIRICGSVWTKSSSGHESAKANAGVAGVVTR
jgi:uncharacterized protein involved in exopolysaccharide biosynthesis